jgi:Cof subfamily protein (haloacid dehalogenase superfamily)
MTARDSQTSSDRASASDAAKKKFDKTCFAMPLKNESGIKLVAIDLDGTLLDDSKRISEQTAAAIGEVSRRGVRVVIASARPPRSVRHLYRQLGLDTWQINYNGALIWDEPGSRVVFHQPMKPELVRLLIDRAREKFPSVLVTCEILDRWHTDRIEQPYTTETGRLFQPDVVAPLEEFLNQPITKLLLLGEPEWIDAMPALLSGGEGAEVSVVRTDPHLVQIMDRRVSKAAALKKVAEHYGVEMLEIAVVAVAMDNAAPAVKAVADWVAPSNNDHGVHAALARFLGA